MKIYAIYNGGMDQVQPTPAMLAKAEATLPHPLNGGRYFTHNRKRYVAK